MDIPALAMQMTQTNVMNQVGIAVLAKNLDTVEEMGDAMTKMMEQSVNPNLGANIDLTIQQSAMERWKRFAEWGWQKIAPSMIGLTYFHIGKTLEQRVLLAKLQRDRGIAQQLTPLVS